MDTSEALKIVGEYKNVIKNRFESNIKVYLYGSYSKGCQRKDSDIDVAVIIPSAGDRWLELSKVLWREVDNVSYLIEPVLLEDCNVSPLYEDVIRTGIAV